MCFRNNWFSEESILMSSKTTENCIKEIEKSSAETVVFGGEGEPLMHPLLPDMIIAAKESGKRCEIITNATLLCGDMGRKIADSGVDIIWISMDGFSRESYEKIRKGSLFSLVTENISGFNKIRKNIALGITFVMMRENENELSYINDFADNIGAEFINLSHALPGEAIKKENCIYDKDYPVGKMHRCEKRNFVKEKNICPFIKDKCIFIKSDGSVSVCMQLLHNSYTYLFDEKRKVYAKSFGNINDTPLSKIVNGKEFLDFYNRVEEFDFPSCTECMGCEMRRENLEDCLFNTFPTCGACLWAQGNVRCP